MPHQQPETLAEELAEELEDCLRNAPEDTEYFLATLQKWENVWNAWHQGKVRALITIANTVGFGNDTLSDYADMRRMYATSTPSKDQLLLEILDLYFKGEILEQTAELGSLAQRLDDSPDEDLKDDYLEVLSTLQLELINCMRKFNLTFSADGHTLADHRNGLVANTTKLAAIYNVMTSTGSEKVPAPDDTTCTIYMAYDALHRTHTLHWGDAYNTRYRSPPTPLSPDQQNPTENIPDEVLAVSTQCYQALQAADATLNDLRERLQYCQGAWQQLDNATPQNPPKLRAAKAWLQWNEDWKNHWLQLRNHYLGKEQVARHFTRVINRAMVEFLDLHTKAFVVDLMNTLEDKATELDSIAVVYPHLEHLSQKMDAHVEDLRNLIETYSLDIDVASDLDDTPQPDFIDKDNFTMAEQQASSSLVLTDSRGLELPIDHLQTIYPLLMRIQTDADYSLTPEEVTAIEDTLLAYDTHWLEQISRNAILVHEAETYHLPRC